jgi:heat shock protein HslJ
MICSEDVMGQGSSFLAAMEKVAAYSIEGAGLSLMDASGALLLGFDGS